MPGVRREDAPTAAGPRVTYVRRNFGVVGKAKQRLSCRRFRLLDASADYRCSGFVVGRRRDARLAFQRVAGNAHELDEIRAGLSRIQGRLSCNRGRRRVGRVGCGAQGRERAHRGFRVSPMLRLRATGQTVSEMWSGDDTVKREMVKAVKKSWGLALTKHEGEWGIPVGGAFTGTSRATELWISVTACASVAN